VGIDRIIPQIPPLCSNYDTAGSDRIRSGKRVPYVSRRHIHSIGPKAKNFSHKVLSAIWAAKISSVPSRLRLWSAKFSVLHASRLRETRSDLHDFWGRLRVRLRQGRVDALLRFDRIALNALREVRITAVEAIPFAVPYRRPARFATLKHGGSDASDESADDNPFPGMDEERMERAMSSMAGELEGLGDRNYIWGVAPVALFMRALGVRIVSPRKVYLQGRNPFPWPVTVRHKGLVVARGHASTTVTFPNGHAAMVTGDAPQCVEDA